MERVRPEDYSEWRGTHLGAVTERLEQSLVLQLAGDLSRLRVLDVGRGDGAYAIAAARQQAQVVALDRDAEMLEAARERAENAGVHVLWVRGEARHPPFANNSFDRVLAVTVLCFDQTPEVAASEMARVLVPGSRLVLGELGAISAWTLWRRLMALLGAKRWATAAFRSPGDLRALAHATGLSVRALQGAVYYPPLGRLAQICAPLDRALSSVTSFGAAFLALAAERTKPRR